MDSDWEELQRHIDEDQEELQSRVDEDRQPYIEVIEYRDIHRFIYQKISEDLQYSDVSKLSREVYQKFSLKNINEKIYVRDFIDKQISLKINRFGSEKYILITANELTYRKFCSINLQNLWEFLQLFDEGEFDNMRIDFVNTNELPFSCTVTQIDDEVFIKLLEPPISQRAFFLQTHRIFNKEFGIRKNEFSFMLEDLYSSEMEKFLTNADMSRRW